MQTTVITDERRHLARVLTTNHTNDWDGSDPVEKIAGARYAVVVERDNDSWVLAANTAQDVAQIALETYTGTEGYDEWVSAVWDMQSCEAITCPINVSVTVEIDGKTYDSAGQR